MAHHEKEYAAVSSALFESQGIIVSRDAPWAPTKVTAEDAAVEGDDRLDCVSLSPSGASIRVAPMDHANRGRKSGQPKMVFARWKQDLHFHDELRVSKSSSSSSSSNGNVTILFEAMARECVSVILSPEMGFVAGRTYEVFLGAQGNMVTTLQRKGGPVAKPSPAPGASNTAEEETNEEDIPADTPPVATRKEGIHVTVPSRVCQERAWTTYWICLCASGKLAAGLGNVPGEQCIAVLTDTEMDPVAVESEPVRHYVGFGNAATSDRQPASPLKVRNVHITAVPNFVETRLDGWTADSQEDTSMDVAVDAKTQALLKEYQEECRKAKARATKFGVPYNEPAPDAFLPWSQARRLRANPKQGFITGIDLYDPAEKAKQQARNKRFGGGGGGDAAEGAEGDNAEQGKDQVDKDGMETEAAALPVVQAWDNEAFVRSQRADPPTSLWESPPTEGVEEEPFIATEKPTFVPEKIHIFSIDWAAFKQIRTNDLMAHFSIYGPSYVEWLGDLGANILFEDHFSAKRALESLSQDLPTPPPGDVAPPKEGESLPDLGAMGWRLCNMAVRKIANDRHGRRGTTARLLVRVATSLDTLKERPSKWPKPPPGFSTKRVLGPGSDFDTTGKERGNKRQKHSRDNDDRQPYEPVGPDGEHPLLSGGLRSSR